MLSATGLEVSFFRGIFTGIDDQEKTTKMWRSAVLVAALSVFGAVCYGPPPRPVPPPSSHQPWDFQTSKAGDESRGHAGPVIWDDLRVTYSPKGQQGGYTQLPRTARDALAQGYITPPEERKANGKVGVMCPYGDPSVCVLFDGVGHIAGMEIGVMKSDVMNLGYPFERHPAFAYRRRFGYDTFITTFYFVDQNVLAKGGRPNIAAQGTGTGLWLKNGPQGKSLFEVPRFEKDLARTLFKRESCVPGMGLHYYYNMSPALQCEDLEPIFGLYKYGQLIGFGFKVFGRATPVKSRVWFESIPLAALAQTIPDAPQCLTDWTDEKGLISLHVFFVDKPWDIKCNN